MSLPLLTVVKATYAKSSGNDVSDKVRALMASNGGNLVIDSKADFNNLFGDPEPKADKLFHLIYRYGKGGAEKTITHAEKHGDIYLPALVIAQGQVLTVNVVKAIGLHDTRLMGKQNPFAKLKCGSEEFKTKVIEKGGTNADWNQSFIFNLDGKDQFMHVQVIDKELLTETVIGRFDIPLPTLAAAVGEVAYNLVRPNDFKKSAGSIVFKCDFKDPNAPVVSAAAAAAPVTAAAAPQPQPQPQPQVVYQQPAVVYQQPQPQMVYQQPQVVYQQPQVVYQQPQVVYQQPQVVYQQQPQIVYQQQPQPQHHQKPHHQHQSAAAVAQPSADCANQRWQYTSSGHIMGFDGRVLDVNGASREAGAEVIYYDKKPDSDSANQTWDYKDGFFYTRMGTGYVIDINGAAMQNGSKLILWNPKAYGNDNQKWDIDQFGFIRSRADRRFCIDVNGGPTAASGMTPVSLWTAKF